MEHVVTIIHHTEADRLVGEEDALDPEENQLL
jgi:hypothetical protein